MATQLDQHPTIPIGEMLRSLRAARGISQLDLALRCDISPRHLSFVETGKSRPGRDIVERLGEELELSLGVRNSLHLAAGYAPRHRETPLSAPPMAEVRQAIALTLAQQCPFPAFAADHHWTLIDANPAMIGLLAFLRPEGPRHDNVLLQIFDPDDIRPFLANWEEVASDLLRHLRVQLLRAPWDKALVELMDRLLSYPGVPENWKVRANDDNPAPVLRTIFATPAGQLSFLSTVTQFSTPLDITAERVRMECMHPADDATRNWCGSRFASA